VRNVIRAEGAGLEVHQASLGLIYIVKDYIRKGLANHLYQVLHGWWR